MKNFTLLAVLCTLFWSCREKQEEVLEHSYVNILCDIVSTKSSLNSIKVLHYYFINTTSGDCIEKTQKSTDLNFGNLTETLKIGTYDCVIIGHSSDDYEIDKNNIAFPKVTETFRGIESFEVERGDNLNINITLDRVNSRIEIISKEKLPKEAKSIMLQLTNVSNNLDFLQAKSDTPEAIGRIFDLREADIGKENLTFAINCFPCDDKESILTITTTDKNDEVLRLIQTESFQLKQNTISRFSGYLFLVFGTPGVGIDLNQDWEEIIENELPD